jgi:transaldolase
MKHQSYFHWLVDKTPTTWWHDSGDIEELQQALVYQASGTTTNPVLAAQALKGRPDYWRASVQALPEDLDGDARAEAMMRIVVTAVADKLLSIYQRTGGRQGYACAQVNPSHAGNREVMLIQARRFHRWGPNISVKLPVTAAGLDVLEECAAEGITTTMTMSYTVPQVLAAGERFERGLSRMLQTNKPTPHCFPVIMIGRLDDYLREVAADQKIGINEEDIRKSGLAVVKRAYTMFKERGYKAVLIIAALRGVYHMTELAGADLIMSIHPKNQIKILSTGVPREQRIDLPVSDEVINRLKRMPEFVKAYEPEGMQTEEFITYGVTQRTLSQFIEIGWKQLQNLKL